VCCKLSSAGVTPSYRVELGARRLLDESSGSVTVWTWHVNADLLRQFAVLLGKLPPPVREPLVDMDYALVSWITRSSRIHADLCHVPLGTRYITHHALHCNTNNVSHKTVAYGSSVEKGLSAPHPPIGRLTSLLFCVTLRRLTASVYQIQCAVPSVWDPQHYAV